MSALGFLATLAALAAVSSWLVGAAVLGAWQLAWRVRAARPALARWVPALLAMPVLIGAALALAVALPAGHGCHCELDAALHLCAAHPERSGPLAPLAAVALGAIALRLAPRARATWTRWLAARALAPGGRPFSRVRAPIGNAVTVALPRPRIVVDAAWWRGLRAAERRIVLAHESAHVRRGDPLVLELCGLLSALLPSSWARRCASAWREHAERQADAAAARAVGDPLAVAALLVDLHRRASPATLGMAMHDSLGLEGRVRALLDGSTVLRAGSDLGGRAAGLLLAASCWPWIVSEPVHHALEGLLQVLA